MCIAYVQHGSVIELECYILFPAWPTLDLYKVTSEAITQLQSSILDGHQNT